ncbi:hypothetical protein BCBBV1cgp36 [Bacillus phage BCASJ1c]|uniref:36 n=1 Tax=Bacillus phage BCASJ1c TaxID=294382 RepID=Q5YA74_9CAUD|nr:hypothetical protein BCBBV1cgp36 [Bacillus phage BCASJ1c]AAU85083.1 36 [Bacillus phage BCASJ1c]
MRKIKLALHYFKLYRHKLISPKFTRKKIFESLFKSG